MDLSDLSIDTGYINESNLPATTRKAATLCMPALIQDTLNSKLVDINEAIRGYWLGRIATMTPPELANLVRKYAPADSEAQKCITQLEE